MKESSENADLKPVLSPFPQTLYFESIDAKEQGQSKQRKFMRGSAAPGQPRVDVVRHLGGDEEANRKR